MLIGLARGFRTAAKFLFPIPEHGLEKRLRRITAPTLVVWGAGDRFVAPSYAEIFARADPRRARGDHSGGGPSGRPRATGAVCSRGGAIRRRGMMGRIAPAH